tara:strand:+ start:171 stop:671 length:501 start_codon:yes stop_codon:yes gene_type:complete
MSGRLLDFKSYIGGSDNVQVIEMFPTTQKTFEYNYASNIALYTFEADSQTLVVDTLTYDRITGLPNFTDSNIIGYFPKTEIANANIVVKDATNGLVDFTIPAQRYTGNITPSARTNVPISVIGFSWTDTETTPTTTESHRWAVVERYEPDTPIGNVLTSAGFVALT